MEPRYQIHPALGIARVGNSDNSFYLAPDGIGELPIECDAHGNEIRTRRRPKYVERFKDAKGQIRRQGARFRLFVYDKANPKDPGREVKLSDPDISQIKWTVHLANKKAIWYSFYVYAGDVMFPNNTYEDNQVPLRNASTPNKERQKLIIDPGPRSLAKPNDSVKVSRHNIPSNYPHASFPSVNEPEPIDELGELHMDSEGRLIVLGGHGNAAGSFVINLFTGADGWYDDISDGPVTCEVTLKNKKKYTAEAWVTVAAPKFAPELVNIVTLDDIQFDVGVRYQKLAPEIYDGKKWNDKYQADFERDIRPITRRIGNYLWVCNVPSMVAFASPAFDLSDPSEANRTNRENYFQYFRPTQAVPGRGGETAEVLMAGNHVPMMPLISGTNPNFNKEIEKFLCLTETQYFLLKQWAAGKFTRKGGASHVAGVHPLDRASVGNCVGSPMCPGVEVTWNTRNPKVYETPYRLKHRYGEEHYRRHGLSIQDYDETVSGQGLEPGDLTKRMSTPWQADLFQCAAQYVHFTEPNVNVDSHYLPIPPTYFVYWWPPQSPMQVISGAMTMEEQRLAGIGAGAQVNYQRGINSYAEMIVGWSYLGFILNQNTGPDRNLFPYFVEKQRNYEEFIVGSVAVGDPFNIVNASDTSFQPVWFLKNRTARKKPKHLFARHIRAT